MKNSDNHDQQTTPSVQPENKKDPWRKYRILAGILTCYVGLTAIGTIILESQISGMYSWLSGILGGSGSNLQIMGGSIRLLLVAIALSSLVGGLLFCRKKRSGSLMVWLAALFNVPISLLVIYLSLYIPMYQSDINWMPVLFSLLVSIYLIWILSKTSPKKSNTPPKPLRAIIVVVATIVCVAIGFKAWDYFMVQESNLIPEIQFQNVEGLRSLLEEGADPNQRTRAGTTSLMLALQSKKEPELAIALLEYGADPNVTSKREPNPYGDETSYEHTPLVFAIEQRFVEVAELMVEKGANVNPEQANKSEKSPLIRAINKEFYDLVIAMLNKGAIVNSDILVQSHAASHGNIELVTLLMEHGAEVNLPKINSSYANALMQATQSRNIDMVKLLMKHGADPRQISGQYTPIKWMEYVIKSREQGGWDTQGDKALLRQLKG